MPTVAEDLDTCQRFLRDTGRLWSRDELRHYYAEGLRTLLVQSQGVRQWRVLDVPPRHTVAITYAWERRYAMGGTVRQWTYTGPTGSQQFSSLWELEQAAGAVPQTQYPAVTQLWEMACSHEVVDVPYRFVLPPNHDRIAGAWWDHLPLDGAVASELDGQETAWYRQQGEPFLFLPTRAGAGSVDVYPIRATDTAGYTYLQWEGLGMPRRITGLREYLSEAESLPLGFAYTTRGDSLHLQAHASVTVLPGIGRQITTDPVPFPGAGYQSTQTWEQELRAGQTSNFTTGQTIGMYPWEAAYGAENMLPEALGLIRGVVSAERQYVPTAPWQAPLGLIRHWHSSEKAVLLWEVVTPEATSIEEADTPTMIPAPLQKYLRYYVLACAFNRQGEGYRPDLAAHWQQRWQRGPQLLRKLGGITYADVRYQREPVSRGRRGIGRAPLPPEYGHVRI